MRLAAMLACTMLACGGGRTAAPPVKRSPPPIDAPRATTADKDRDGIEDSADGCIDEPEDLDGALDDDGCPEADADLDMVLDVCDLCPLAPETFNGLDDDDGCPDCALPSPTAAPRPPPTLPTQPGCPHASRPPVLVRR